MHFFSCILGLSQLESPVRRQAQSCGCVMALGAAAAVVSCLAKSAGEVQKW